MLNVILPLNSLKNVVSLYKEIIELIVFIWEHIIKGYDSYSKFLVNIFFLHFNVLIVFQWKNIMF